MKGYFQTTPLTPKNTLFIVAKSSIYIPEQPQAYVVPNHAFLTLFSVDNYKIITLYLNGVFLKCIWIKTIIKCLSTTE